MARPFSTAWILIAAIGAMTFVPHTGYATGAADTSAKPAIKWVEILPDRKTTDPKAQKIAQDVLKDDIARYTDPKTGFFLAARFFNAPGLPKDSFIIAKFQGFVNCGTMGCMSYFLKKTDPDKNAWKIVHENNFNSIVTSVELLERKPAFYTRGRGESPYNRYNAATGKYENGK